MKLNTLDEIRVTIEENGEVFIFSSTFSKLKTFIVDMYEVHHHRMSEDLEAVVQVLKCCGECDSTTRIVKNELSDKMVQALTSLYVYLVAETEGKTLTTEEQALEVATLSLHMCLVNEEHVARLKDLIRAAEHLDIAAFKLLQDGADKHYKCNLWSSVPDENQLFLDAVRVLHTYARKVDSAYQADYNIVLDAIEEQGFISLEELLLVRRALTILNAYRGLSPLVPRYGVAQVSRLTALNLDLDKPNDAELSVLVQTLASVFLNLNGVTDSNSLSYNLHLLRFYSMMKVLPNKSVDEINSLVDEVKGLTLTTDQLELVDSLLLAPILKQTDAVGLGVMVDKAIKVIRYELGLE